MTIPVPTRLTKSPVALGVALCLVCGVQLGVVALAVTESTAGQATAGIPVAATTTTSERGATGWRAPGKPATDVSRNTDVARERLFRNGERLTANGEKAVDRAPENARGSKAVVVHSVAGHPFAPESSGSSRLGGRADADLRSQLSELAAAPARLAPPVKEARPAAASTRAPVLAAAKPRSVPVPSSPVKAATRRDTRPAAKPRTRTGSVKPSVKPHAELSPSAVALMKQPSAGFVMQLASLKDDRGVEKFIRKHGLKGNLHRYQKYTKGKRWIVLVESGYADRTAAVAAAANLTRRNGLKPWVRPLVDVQGEIQRGSVLTAMK